MVALQYIEIQNIFETFREFLIRDAELNVKTDHNETVITFIYNSR